jgi:GntR family transcriptional regulator
MRLVNKRSEAKDKAGPSLDFHPLYLQIKELLIQRVLQGDWKPGELLPSEFKLAAEFKVSQGTVRKALDELAAEKAVIRMQGKGTFVAARNTRHTPLHFFRIALDSGERWVSHNTRLLLFQDYADPTDEEMRELALPPDSKVVRIERLRYFQDRPMIREVVSLAAARFPNFGTTYKQAMKTNLYALLERDYGVLVVRANERLRARLATDHETKILELAPNTPVLDIERLSYTIDGLPIEFRHMICETSKQHYATIIN